MDISDQEPDEFVVNVLAATVPEHKLIPVGRPLESVARIAIFNVPGEPSLYPLTFTEVILCEIEGVKVWALKL